VSICPRPTFSSNDARPLRPRRSTISRTSPEHLRSILEPIGFGQQDGGSDRVTVVHESPIEVDLVEVMMRLKDEIQRRAVKRLVIDAVGELREAAIDPSRLRAIVWELVHYCAANGVTPLINGGLTLLGEQSPEEMGIATMVDNVLMLDRGKAPLGDPSITVIKTRRSAYSRGAHRVMIDETGFHISSPITS
jgi:KaiC/GvpD/RAD55 family RecA-like ATPase